MPLYMDIHIVPGVKAKDVAAAHRQDLIHQDEYGCNCVTYWIDEERETIFCLIDAPDKDAVREMHRKAHGLVPNKIIEVSSSIVKSFLGRIYDPDEKVIMEEGLKVFSDPSFRLLLVTRMEDPVLLQHRLGKEAAMELMENIHQKLRKNFSMHEGSEVEYSGSGSIVSFDSAAKAIGCSVSILEDIPEKDTKAAGIKIAVNGGEPIEKSTELFGDAISFAGTLCNISAPSKIALSVNTKSRVPQDLFHKKKDYFFSLNQPDEDFIRELFTLLEDKYSDPSFDIPGFSQSMAMSQAQLYRKITSISGLSGNTLLKDYRLEKAKDLLRQQRHSVSQITFDTGFSSPSYFTKCFKSKYGLLPMEYVELVKTS